MAAVVAAVQTIMDKLVVAVVVDQVAMVETLVLGQLSMHHLIIILITLFLQLVLVVMVALVVLGVVVVETMV